jgi:hypothetical protein
VKLVPALRVGHGGLAGTMLCWGREHGHRARATGQTLARDCHRWLVLARKLIGTKRKPRTSGAEIHVVVERISAPDRARAYSLRRRNPGSGRSCNTFRQNAAWLGHCARQPPHLCLSQLPARLPPPSQVMPAQQRPTRRAMLVIFIILSFD